MTDRPASTAAAVVALVGVALLANPLYLHAPPDRGGLVVHAERTSAADGAAALSPAVERTADLPPVARSAARRALANGSFAISRSGTPLAAALFADEWRYLGSQRHTAVYRVRVTADGNETRLRLENVTLQRAEADLGLTPPGRLAEVDDPKEVAWLAERSPAVVLVAEFGSPWTERLLTAVERGRLTVPNGNDAATLRPLGGRVAFVAHDDAFHRVAVRETDTRVVLATTRADTRAALAAANVSVTAASDLPPDVRPVVRDAIAAEDGYARASREETNATRLEALRGRLLRDGGAYYRLQLGHADDIDLTPLYRLVLTALGVVALLVGLAMEWRARNR
jgi:hypothetical protein